MIRVGRGLHAVDFRAENGTLRRGDPSQSENFHAIVGDLARVGYWLVNSRIFAGVLPRMGESGGFLPKTAPAVFSQNRGIPTFLLGDYLPEHRIALNSHFPCGSLAAKRRIRRVLPQERP